MARIIGTRRRIGRIGLLTCGLAAHAWRAQPRTNVRLRLNSDKTEPADRYRFFASQAYPGVNLLPALVITDTVP